MQVSLEIINKIIIRDINHHLQLCYNFDKHENMYKYYLPNLMRHHGYVNSDQVPHLDFHHITNEYKPKQIPEKKGNQIKGKKHNYY